MKVYSMYGVIYNLKQVKTFYTFSLSLGMNKGFMNVTYFVPIGLRYDAEENPDAWIPEDRQNVFIPQGQLSVVSYVSKDGENKDKIQLTTNYMELVATEEQAQKAWEKRESRKEEQKFNGPRIDSSLDTLSKKEKQSTLEKIIGNMKDEKVKEDDDSTWELDL